MPLLNTNAALCNVNYASLITYMHNEKKDEESIFLELKNLNVRELMSLKQYELNKFHFAFYESVYTTASVVCYCLCIQYFLLRGEEQNREEGEKEKLGVGRIELDGPG